MKKTSNINMNQMSQNQVTVVLVMLAVIVWVLGLIISNSVLGTILFNNKLISNKRSVEATLDDNLAQVEDIKANFEQLEEDGLDKDIVLRALPTEQDVPGLASKLEALMSASSVAFKSFGLEGGSSIEEVSEVSGEDGATEGNLSKGVQEFVYTIKVEGSYSGILQMLRNFEREITPMRIVSIRIDGTEQIATAELLVKAYYQPAVTLELEKETLR